MRAVTWGAPAVLLDAVATLVAGEPAQHAGAARLLSAQLPVTGDQLRHDPDALFGLQQAFLDGPAGSRRIAARVLVFSARPNVTRPHLRQAVVLAIRRDRARMKTALVMDDRHTRQRIEVMFLSFDLERGGVSRCIHLADLGVSKAN